MFARRLELGSVYSDLLFARLRKGLTLLLVT